MDEDETEGREEEEEEEEEEDGDEKVGVLEEERRSTRSMGRWKRRSCIKRKYKKRGEEAN